MTEQAKSEQPTQINLLRHGEIDGPAALYGRTDVLLSENGQRQMRQQTRKLLYLDNIISSPLRRCSDFATEIARIHELDVKIEPDFQECDFGEWDGIQFDDQSQHWPLMTSFWQSPEQHPPPKGESLEGFHSRVIKAWSSLLQSGQNQCNLVVCHGGVIRQILGHVLPADWQDGAWYSQLQIGYGSLTRITIPAYEGALPRVDFIGLPADVGHENFA
ncbi:histidine phosphatase family protein [Paraglaciecola sp. 2405UD69-4]|uniref:histidine phosphatase family protein n=1 Tax=Paraglaciecola sp. 2405UD69-4 TaxID=3391836 RepID=UPI0039C8F1F6